MAGVRSSTRAILPAAVSLPRLNREARVVIAIAATAASFGAITGLEPKLGVAIAALLVVTTLAFCAPVAHLLLFVAITALVPPEIQSQLGVGGGTNAPGLLASDLLLATGLARAILVPAGRQLERRELAAAGLAIALLMIAGLQAVHGVLAGTGVSEVAAEFRVIVALAASVLIAMPLLADERSRRRLLTGLIVLGLAIGAWGILQWVLGLRFTGAEEALEGASSRFVTAGRTVGQYAFGVVVVVALAVWTSGGVRSRVARWSLIAAVGLNAVALLFTFERTFWVVTVLGIVFVTLASTGIHRLKLLVLTPAALVILFLVLLTVAPAELNAAGERLLSIGKYQSDPSIRYRIEESRRVIEQIAARPLHGSGLGASIVIGRPGTTVTPKPRRYAENGYLWVTWKLGIPGMLVLLALLTFAILRRAHPNEPDVLTAAARRGSQAALVALAAASVTFPSFNALAITPVIGVMVALCSMPLGGGARDRRSGGASSQEDLVRNHPRPGA